MSMLAIVLALSACASQGRRLMSRAGNIQESLEDHEKLPEVGDTVPRQVEESEPLELLAAALLAARGPAAAWQSPSVAARSPGAWARPRSFVQQRQELVRHLPLSLAKSPRPLLPSRVAAALRMQEEEEPSPWAEAGKFDDGQVASPLGGLEEIFEEREDEDEALISEIDSGSEWGPAIDGHSPWQSRLLWQNYSAENDDPTKSYRERKFDRIKWLYDHERPGERETPMHDSVMHGWDPRLTQCKSEDTPAFAQVWWGYDYLQREGEALNLTDRDIMMLNMKRGREYEADDQRFMQATGEFPPAQRPDLWKPGMAYPIPENCTTWDAYEKRILMVDSTKDLVYEYDKAQEIGEIAGVREYNEETGELETYPIRNQDLKRGFTEEGLKKIRYISGRAALERMEEERQRNGYYELEKSMHQMEDEIERSFADPYDTVAFYGIRKHTVYGPLEREFTFPPGMGDEYSCSMMDFFKGQWVPLDDRSKSTGIDVGDSFDSLKYDPKKGTVNM
mmetsp:Transcript_80974/g.147753  ORF Transcript_80974/g.147753 Transcript_80974/m.147753 type:complete len:507 (-) Transcript_80974:92-1612(-)